MREIWRVGRHLVIAADIYRQTGADPSPDDEWIGRMDTPEDAAKACAAVNTIHRMHAAVGWEVTAADLAEETP